MGSRNHSLTALRSTMGFFNMMLCLASFGLLGPVRSQWLYPGLYSGLTPPSTPLMTGTFVSKKIHPNQEQIVKAYNAVWGYDGEGADEVEGTEVSIGELTLDMKYNQETTSTGWTTDGSELKTYTWRTGPNSIRLRNTNGDVTEMKDLVFHPNGFSASGSVSNKVTSAFQAEFYERVDENGAAKTLYLGYY